MIIVYAQAGSAMERAITLTINGHAAVALTGLDPARFLSYVTIGKSVLDGYKRGLWSRSVYRIQLPSFEDGCGSTLSESRILRFYQNYKNTGMDCVGVAHAALVAGGARAYEDSMHWPVISPSGLASWASDIQRNLIKSGLLTNWPPEWQEGRDGEEAFFGDDEYHRKQTDNERNRMNGRAFDNSAVVGHGEQSGAVEKVRATLAMHQNMSGSNQPGLIGWAGLSVSGGPG